MLNVDTYTSPPAPLRPHLSGAMYNGSYVSGEREGHGKYCDMAGDCYEGMWRKDKRAGRGT